MASYQGKYHQVCPQPCSRWMRVNNFIAQVLRKKYLAEPRKKGWYCRWFLYKCNFFGRKMVFLNVYQFHFMQEYPFFEDFAEKIGIYLFSQRKREVLVKINLGIFRTPQKPVQNPWSWSKIWLYNTTQSATCTKFWWTIKLWNEPIFTIQKS